MSRYGNNPRNSRYTNWGKTYKACSMALLGAGKALNPIATEELNDVARRFLREQDAQWPHSSTAKSASGKEMKFGGDADHPWYSGQLHDSVAVRISQKNRITGVHYMPPSQDTGKPQHTETIKNIVGAEWARDIAEGHGPRFFLPGVQVQLIVAVPYADKVNEDGRHAGFVDHLADELFSAVNDWLYKGGLSRPTLIADDKGVRVINKSNITSRKIK